MFVSHHSLLGPSGSLEETIADYDQSRSPLQTADGRTLGIIPQRFGLPDPFESPLYTERLKRGILLVLADLSQKLSHRRLDAVYVGQGRARLTPKQRPVTEFLDWLVHALAQNGISVPRERCVCMESSCTTGIALARSAARQIAVGRDENVLLLSFDPVSPAPLSVMEALGVLTRRAKPSAYSHDRDGFAQAEAICAAVLSAEPNAQGPNVAFRSAALATDGGLTGMDGDGRGLAECIGQVMREWGIQSPSFIKAHGTGTRLNDEVEGEVLNRFFSEADGVPLVSFKPQFGHCLNGSGLFEMLMAVHVLSEDRLMPTMNVSEPKLFKGIRVSQDPINGSGLRSCLGLAIGFGGVNAAYSLERQS